MVNAAGVSACFLERMQEQCRLPSLLTHSFVTHLVSEGTMITSLQKMLFAAGGLSLRLGVT